LGHRGKSEFGRNGFTLTELAIGMLIASLLVLGATKYFKSQATALQDSDADRQIDQEADLVAKRLSQIIQDAVFVNPPCDGNPASSASVLSCSVVKIRGGIVPLPGSEASDVMALNSFALPSNLTISPSELTKTNDALRVVKFDFDGAPFDCSLDRSVETNPSVDQEKLWVETSCASKLTRNKLYVIAEQFSGVAYASVFQITNISGNEVSTSSSGNLFNQTGGLGRSGFTRAARLFPVRLEEYALDASALTVVKREISPGGVDQSGVGAWSSYVTGVETIQFWPVTIASTGSFQHQRTMSFSADPANNGVEDIRGVIPWFVLKGLVELTDSSKSSDNPFTSVVESDGVRRSERRFFVRMDNFSN